MPEETIRAAFPAAAQNYLTIVDRVPESEVIAAYREHDVFAMASSYEGFGMVLLEAMTQRLPVVSTPVGCARALVSHERTGLVVPTRDPVALAAALGADARRAGPPERRSPSTAFEAVRDMTWARTARATLAVYEKARANGNA